MVALGMHLVSSTDVEAPNGIDSIRRALIGRTALMRSRAANERAANWSPSRRAATAVGRPPPSATEAKKQKKNVPAMRRCLPPSQNVSVVSSDSGVLYVSRKTLTSDRSTPRRSHTAASASLRWFVCDRVLFVCFSALAWSDGFTDLKLVPLDAATNSSAPGSSRHSKLTLKYSELLICNLKKNKRITYNDNDNNNNDDDDDDDDARRSRSVPCGDVPCRHRRATNT